MTHKELLEEFLLFEDQHNLFNIRIEQIPIWEYMRVNIFGQIRNELVASIFSTGGKKINNFSKAFKNFGYHSLSKSPYEISKNVDLLVFNHSRRRETEGVYQDIHTDPFLPDLDMNYAVLENFFNWSHLKPALTTNLYYLDRIELPAAMVRILSSAVPKASDLAKLEVITAQIKTQWGVDLVDFKEHVTRFIRQYRYAYPRLEKVIKKANPKKILTVVSYGVTNQIVNEIARKYSIKIIEVQHGVVGKLHVAYNYKQSSGLQTVPDYFLAWGSYWVDGARMPMPKENIKMVGFPYLDSFKKQNDILRKPKQLVIISQMSQKIAHFAQEMAMRLPDYTIVFKAHPTEYKVVGEKYPKLATYQNITIIADDKKSLYTLFQESSYVFGVYSTALIEAIAFCDAIFVIKLPGWELFENLSNTFNFIDSADEAAKAIEEQKYISASKDLEKYFVQDAITKTCRFLEDI